VVLLALAGMGVGYKLIRNYYYVSAYGDTVAIMRGLQGSVLGIRLQQPYLLGCINDRGELSQISYGQEIANLGCDLMRLQDLRPSGRAQVTAGLPAGSLDDAIGQLRELTHNSLLPQCAPPTSSTPATAAPPRSGTTTPTTPATTTPGTTKPGTTKPTTSTPKPPQPSAAQVPAPQQQPGTDCRATV